MNTVTLSGTKLYHSFHASHLIPSEGALPANRSVHVPDDVLTYNVFNFLEMRDLSVISAVSKQWDNCINDVFEKRTNILSKCLTESSNSSLAALDLANSDQAPRPSVRCSVQALDLATSTRSPVPPKRDNKEWIRCNGVPTLEAAVARIKRLINKLGDNDSLRFEVKMPLDPGAHFRGFVSIKNNTTSLPQNATFVLEQKLPQKQALQDFLKDVEEVNKVFTQFNPFPLYDLSLPPTSRRLNLSALLPPQLARLPMKRLYDLLETDEVKEILEKLRKKTLSPNPSLDTTLNEQDFGFCQGLYHEIQYLKSKNMHLFNQLKLELYNTVSNRITALHRNRLIESENVLIAPPTLGSRILSYAPDFNVKKIEELVLIIIFCFGVATIIDQACDGPSPEVILPVILGLIYYQMQKDDHGELEKKRYTQAALVITASLISHFGPKLLKMFNRE